MTIVKIYFEDHGQDFLAWDVNFSTGKVVRCTPFQGSLWCQCIVTNIDQLYVGGIVEYEAPFMSEPSNIKYPIENLEYLEIEQVVDVKSSMCEEHNMKAV